jgi:hypothetical protein
MRFLIQSVLLTLAFCIISTPVLAENEKFYSLDLDPDTSISLPSSWHHLTIDSLEEIRELAKNKFGVEIDKNLKIHVIAPQDKSVKIFFALQTIETFKNNELPEVANDELKKHNEDFLRVEYKNILGAFEMLGWSNLQLMKINDLNSWTYYFTRTDRNNPNKIIMVYKVPLGNRLVSFRYEAIDGEEDKYFPILEDVLLSLNVK